ncbi:MAG: hypothetical protein E8D46_07360 [Nitrospira sp.]|nr:MAG: hypothetical protein E8D46_07360 [Nitrospira sp.]
MMTMTQSKHQYQNGWDSPKFLIDCVLANVNKHLEADGCVLERLEVGSKLTTPDSLRIGDFLKVQLWLEGEDTFLDIRLAEVRKIQEHWVAVEVIQLSTEDRMRLKQYITAPGAIPNQDAARMNHLFIRA